MEIFRRTGFDKSFSLTTLILISFGLVIVFSSSAILSNEIYERPFNFFIHQLVGACIGLTLAIFVMVTKIPFYQSNIFIYGLLFLSFILLSACMFMPAIGHTNRWLFFFGLRFQPSELAKISLILFIAKYLSRKKEKINELSSLAVPIAILMIFILLIIKEPDYGTAILIFVICATMLFIGGVKFSYFFYTGIFFLALFIFYLFQASYRLNRFIAFLSPTSDTLGSGYQAFQSKLAIGSGGLFGVGPGQSTQKLFFLPYAHTDYIYSIVGEEFGLIGAVGVLFLFGLFLWRGLVIARNAPTLFTRLLAAGLTMAICTQALLNISIVLGLGPATGLPLPLFSFGRSSLVCTLFSIGILLHISQRKTSLRRK